MTFSFSDMADALRGGAPISAQDVLTLRRWAWQDGGISSAEAETIFDLNDLAKERSGDWVDFFVEAIGEYVVNEQEPRGYVDQAKADWLVARIDKDGRIDTLAELELLVKVMETSLNAPESLKTYALRQIEQTVVSGEGPTRSGEVLRPGVIDEAEVILLRRLLFATGGEGAATVSRDEAELLWRLKDATKGGDNAAGWQKLFVQAVGNHVMAHNLYRPLARTEAQRLESFMDDRKSSVLGFLGRMASNISDAPIREAFAKDKAEDFDAEVAADRVITADERDWLKGHVDADGAADPLEQALLDFIAEESGTRL